MKQSRSGFTVVELVVVISVIAILATLTLASYSIVQQGARDAKRKSDLSSIGEAIQLYRQKFGDDVKRAQVNTAQSAYPYEGFVRTESQCGSNGNGWFNYQPSGSFAEPGSTDAAYQSSILKCLVDNGYLDDTFIDPFNCTTTSGSAAGAPRGGSCTTNGFAYMKYSFGSGDTSYTCLYAVLEAEDRKAELQSASSKCPNSDHVATTYGMNYMLRVD